MLQKIHSFFSQAPTHHSFNFNLQFLYELLSICFISLKLCVGFSIFNSVSFLLNFIFLFKKKHGLFDFKTSQFLKNENNRKATHSIALRPLSFKLQQEVRKFNDICVSWSSPKIDLETSFLNLGAVHMGWAGPAKWAGSPTIIHRIFETSFHVKWRTIRQTFNFCVSRAFW